MENAESYYVVFYKKINPELLFFLVVKTTLLVN